jgi:hypothetical protein
VIDFDRTTDFQLPQRLLLDWSEDALAQAFADHRYGQFLYHTEQRRWYRRGYSETGEPQWQLDTALEIESAIRAFLRETAEALAPRVSGIRMRLGSAATLLGVKRLVQSELAGDDDDLEPGALARQDAFFAALRAPASRPQAQPAPTSPPARPTYPTPPESPAGRQGAPEELTRFISESAAWCQRQKPLPS